MGKWKNSLPVTYDVILIGQKAVSSMGKAITCSCFTDSVLSWRLNVFNELRNKWKLAVIIVLFLIFPILTAGVAHTATLGNLFSVAATAGQELASYSYAFDGTNYLVGIQGDAAQGNKITAQLVSQSGTLVGSRISVGRTGSAPFIAFDGTNYLMAWSDYATSPNNKLYGVFIRKDGAVVNQPFVIEDGPLSQSEIGGISFGGGKYLVVYHKIGEGIREAVYGRPISPSGEFGYWFVISNGYGNKGLNNVAFDGTNFFVVWNDNISNNQVRGKFVSPNGVEGTEIAVKASGLPNDNPLTVAFDGTNYLVVWTEEVNATLHNWDVFGQLVTPAGVLSGGKISISTAPGQQFTPLIAFDGTNHLISWTDMRNDANGNWACDFGEGTCMDIRGQLVSKSGTPVGSEFIINNNDGNQSGGFAGQAVNGRLLGMVNDGVNISASGSVGGDVYGVSLAVEDIPASISGICGTAAGQTFASKPVSNLCSVGTPTIVAGSGPWTWKCTGSGGGTTADCTANILLPLICRGDINGDEALTIADAILTLKVLIGSNPLGIRKNYPTSGADVNSDGRIGVAEAISILQVLSGLRLSECYQDIPVDGVCGSSNGGIFTTAPAAGLCGAGLATSVTGDGPWSWSCTGANGGATAACAATLQGTPVDGVCGSSNGGIFTTAPAAGLCGAGSATSVTGDGPWSWTCTGANGGATAACAATLQGTYVWDSAQWDNCLWEQ